jgi:glycosyltransferase involved in cell wall biosynthesis
LSNQLNLGIDAAVGKYIARLDADDLAEPTRFAKQIRLMEAESAIGICGSQAQLFDARGDREVWHYPTDPDATHAVLFLRSSFLHPGVMIRKAVLVEHRLRFDPTIQVAQDYELWYRMLKVTRGTNLPERLTRYRISESQMTQAQAPRKTQECVAIRRTMIRDLGLEPTAERMAWYDRILATKWEQSGFWFSAVASWLNEVVAANEERRVFPSRAFRSLLAEMFFYRCQCATRRGFDGLAAYRQLKCSSGYRPPLVELTRMKMKAILKCGLAK